MTGEDFDYMIEHDPTGLLNAITADEEELEKLRASHASLVAALEEWIAAEDAYISAMNTNPGPLRNRQEEIRKLKAGATARAALRDAKGEL